LNRVAARIKSGEATEEEVEKASDARDALFQRVQSGMTLEKAIRALSVGENEKRTLVVQRAGVKTPLTLGLTTATTRVPDPSNRTLASGVDYVRLPAFDDKTANFVTLALANAGGRDSGGGAAGIVLDLRDNPGGPLPFVQSVAGALLRAARPNAAANSGRLFTLVGPKNKRIGLTATGAAAASTGTTRPLVVLVNQGTAGEAEALAAALRDKGAAILMGAKTFGDPLVRTLFPLADGSGFLLTTGKLVGATGADWQNAGLAPTIVLAAGTSEERVLARAASVAASAAARSEVAHAAAPIDVDSSR
jgi:carboxyl-terminal processing protease